MERVTPAIRQLATVICVLGIAVFAPSGAFPARAGGADLGTVDFPTSGAEEAQEAFLEGVLWLHSFQYGQAREAFRRAQELDPDFALAYWGEALTHEHPLWDEHDREAAREVLGRLAPTREERLALAPTERETGYLRAVEVLFAEEGSEEERVERYAEAMEELAARSPEDLEAKAFHSVAILGTARDGRDFEIYMRAGAVAEEVFMVERRHPGAVHYMIHSYDDPIHAPLGLRAARVYAEIAPAAPHALHMPSHIFFALGMWDRVAASNEDSLEAARAMAEETGRSLGGHGRHAMRWLHYAYLQQDRAEEAAELRRAAEEFGEGGDDREAELLALELRASETIETRDWSLAGFTLPEERAERWPVAAATFALVDGLAAHERGREDDARKAREELRRLAAESDEEKVDICRLELEGSQALFEGREGDAVSLLRRAADLESELALDFGPPSPPKPASELLGEVLLEIDRAEEAMDAFRRALDREPGRRLSLQGLARAADAAGEEGTAREARERLRAIGDSESP